MSFLKRNLYYGLFAFLCNFPCECVLSSQRFFGDYTILSPHTARVCFLILLYVGLDYVWFFWVRVDQHKRTICSNKNPRVAFLLFFEGWRASAFVAVCVNWPKHESKGEWEIIFSRRFCLLWKQKRRLKKIVLTSRNFMQLLKVKILNFENQFEEICGKYL